MCFLFFFLYFDVIFSDEIPVGPRRFSQIPRPSTPNLPNIGRRMRRGVQGAVEFMRHSRCERYRQRYEALITEALATTVMNVNVQCECHSRHWMACSCATDNEPDIRRLQARLDPDQPEQNLRPFQVMDFSFFLCRTMAKQTEGWVDSYSTNGCFYSRPVSHLCRSSYH